MSRTVQEVSHDIQFIEEISVDSGARSLTYAKPGLVHLNSCLGQTRPLLCIRRRKKGMGIGRKLQYCHV